MIAHWDLCQGTEQWFEKKWGKIGGSTSKGLFVNSDTLLHHILSEQLEAFNIDDDPYESYDMQRGIELEPLARERLSEYAGVEFLSCGLLECEENDLLVISPDGLTKDMKVGCEIKSPAKKKHTEILLSKPILSDYIHQCLHNFTVNPYLERLYFASFRPESQYPLAVREMTKDSIIDLGTKAKPNCKKVSEWVDIAKIKAKELSDNIDLYKKQLAF